MKNLGLRRQKINRKETGEIEWLPGMFMTLFLVLVLMTQMQCAIFRASALYLEDALAASNLASAVIDMREYGISHTVNIISPKEAYAKYICALKENLQLDENWECANQSLISGKVTVENYTIYNVDEETVSACMVMPDGSLRTEEGTVGKMAAPNGISIEQPGIYSELSFPVKGLFGISIQAHKGKLVDIVAQEENK